MAYLAFSIPALIAGVATTRYGLHQTALVYSAALVVVAGIAAGMLVFRIGGEPARPAEPARETVPPGPCTAPPCAQAMHPARG